MLRLVMLGTGHAMVTKCYNTCFVLESDKGSVMVDAGGGNGILTQVEKAGLDWSGIRALFITHAHTDHIIGAIWVISQINSLIQHQKYHGCFKNRAKKYMEEARQSFQGTIFVPDDLDIINILSSHRKNC